MKKHIQFLIIICLTLFFSCSSKPDGSEFVGKWKAADNQSYYLNISKSGESFMISSNCENGLSTTGVATLTKEGNLDLGLVGKLVYDKASKQLIFSYMSQHWVKVGE